MQPSSVSLTIARVRAWLCSPDINAAKVALEAGVDEKTIRNARDDDWNPTTKTLLKLEAIMPARRSRARKDRGAAAEQEQVA